MFIKTSTVSKSNGQTYKTHYLVEGYRDTGKSKHKYICSLSALPDKAILTLKTYVNMDTGRAIDLIDCR